MNMTRARTRLWTALIGMTATGCAQDVGDVDRTQPNLLPKSMFTDHAWYVRQTVVDVPPTSTFSFVGETGTMETIRWDVQQDMLVGYRAYEKVPGSDSMADHEAARVSDQPVVDGKGDGRNPDVFKDNPIVAYPITEHVDVIREYNARTGEQSNVIVEDQGDRPWYERSYMRVDWSSNMVASFEFLSTVKNVARTAGGYVEENEGGPDAFLRHETNDGDIDYFDFTERMIVEPTENGCILGYNMQLGDCTSAEIKIRSSFLRVDEERERDFVAMPYDDRQQGEFGYFRVERPTYDRRRGVTWSGAIYLATRHDLWKHSRDDAGQPRPYADRDLRPVVYQLSAGFPEALRGTAEQIAADWDTTFKKTVSFLRNESIEDLEAELLEQTDDTCMFCLDTNEDGSARIGDLRHNFLYWVDNPQLTGPLGYGPSSPNPETGRIVAGMAYVYGAAVDTQSEAAKDIVDLLNGDRIDIDFLDAAYAREQLLARRPAVTGAAAERLANIRLEDAEATLWNPGQRARLQFLRETGLPQAKPGYDKRQLQRIEDTSLVSLLLNDEIVMSRTNGQYHPGDELPDDVVKSLMPAQWATAEAVKRNDARMLKAARNSLWLTDFADPSIVGLAKEAKGMNLSGDALFDYLRERIFRGVMLHEVGHTVGLRHNFGASADALNYQDEYWPLRDQTILDAPGTVQEVLEMNCEAESVRNAEACEEQRNSKMHEYQYSSIMDYGAKFNSDIHGLGKYDIAAIASGYGDIVEVLAPEVTDGMLGADKAVLVAVSDVRTPLAGSLPEAMHYTELPALFGGVDQLKNRQWMLRQDYQAARGDDNGVVRVPYIACYDEYVDSTAFCHRWDEGADEWEITSQYINTYRDYYPLINFQRDRVGFDPGAVGDRITSRYFLPITNMYQHWLFSGGGGGVRSIYSEMSALRGFSLLWNVMATPRYGSYVRQGASFQFATYDKAADADLYLPPGLGRRQYSRYDVQSGYNLFQHVLESGYFYEQMGALIALTSNDASVLGVGADVSADALTYSIPYYLVFQQEIDQLFSGIVTRDSKIYGPTVTGGTVRPRDLYLEALGAVEPAEDFLDVAAPWSTRIYTMLYGMALLSTNYDLTFLQRGQVALAGESETLSVGAGYEEANVTDPDTGRTYVAYYDPDGDVNQFLAAKIILGLQPRVDELAALDPDSVEARQSRAVVRDAFQDLDILRALYSDYQYIY